MDESRENTVSPLLPPDEQTLGYPELKALALELYRDRDAYKELYLAAQAEEEALQTRLQLQEAQTEALRRDCEHLTQDYNEISHAFWWRITKPLRSFTDLIRRLFPASDASRSLPVNEIVPDPAEEAAKAELSRQRAESANAPIKFSLLLPLSGTVTEEHLYELLSSLRTQSYPNWELCISALEDAAPLPSLPEADPRIRSVRLSGAGQAELWNRALSMAEGDYLVLIGPEVLLPPSALYDLSVALSDGNTDLLYTDEALFRESPSDAFTVSQKHRFHPDDLCGCSFMGRLTVFRHAFLSSVGLFDSAMEGALEYDLLLRASEQTSRIRYLAKVLCFRREGAAESETDEHAELRAVSAHLRRVGIAAEAESCGNGLYHLRFPLPSPAPLVSILIPTQEHFEDLSLCLESIFSRTTYPNYEVVLIENGSLSDRIFQYYTAAEKLWPRLRVIQWQGGFNYSSICNFGAAHCRGEYLLLLNNDTQIITPGWIEEMLMLAAREDVGAVGAKLCYPDDTVQHAGVALSAELDPIHIYRGASRWDRQLLYVREMFAVTGACLMVRRALWEEVGGLDETFEVTFNDIDLCLRLRSAGYKVIYTPFAELYHAETKTRGSDELPKNHTRFLNEQARFRIRWESVLHSSGENAGLPEMPFLTP